MYFFSVKDEVDNRMETTVFKRAYLNSLAC